MPTDHIGQIWSLDDVRRDFFVRLLIDTNTHALPRITVLEYPLFLSMPPVQHSSTVAPPSDILLLKSSLFKNKRKWVFGLSELSPTPVLLHPATPQNCSPTFHVAFHYVALFLCLFKYFTDHISLLLSGGNHKVSPYLRYLSCRYRPLLFTRLRCV